MPTEEKAQVVGISAKVLEELEVKKRKREELRDGIVLWGFLIPLLAIFWAYAGVLIYHIYQGAR